MEYLKDTFESQQRHFAIASKIYVHWDAKAIGDMPLLFTFENSTSPLCLTPEDTWTAGRPLHVRLHSKILHGSGVFLSHLIHDPDSDSTEENAGSPYGRPFVMKIVWGTNTRHSKIQEEVGIMRKLSDFAYVNDPDFSQRIPRVYAVGTNDSLSREHHLIISAYFMEHFEEAYPLALADDISPHFRYAALLISILKLTRSAVRYWKIGCIGCMTNTRSYIVTCQARIFSSGRPNLSVSLLLDGVAR